MLESRAERQALLYTHVVFLQNGDGNKQSAAVYIIIINNKN